MRAQASFQSILEQKLKTQTAFSENTSASSSRSFQHSVDQDPAHLAFLMGTLNKTAFTAPVTKIYPTPPRAPKPPPPPHSLTLQQQLAYEFFLANGAELNPAFSQKQLKNAFRRTALRLHPDMNKGACGPFIALKNHYRELDQLFDTTTVNTVDSAAA